MSEWARVTIPRRGARSAMLARLGTLCLAAALCAAEALCSLPTLARAAAPPVAERVPTHTDCPEAMSAGEVSGAIDTVSVNLVGGISPPPGTVTAYSGNRAWTGSIAHSLTTDSGTRTSFNVRTTAPLDAVSYTAPSGCTVYAIVVKTRLPANRTPDPIVDN